MTPNPSTEEVVGLVERLREHNTYDGGGYEAPTMRCIDNNDAILNQAADEIERLTAIAKRLVEIRDWCHDEAHDARRAYDAVADEARALLPPVGEGGR
jgi:hypothetical protein